MSAATLDELEQALARARPGIVPIGIRKGGSMNLARVPKVGSLALAAVVALVARRRRELEPHGRRRPRGEGRPR